MAGVVNGWSSNFAWAAILAVGLYAFRRSRSTASPQVDLRGPPRKNWLWAYTSTLFGAPGSREVIEAWTEEYGGVFKRPVAFGGSDVSVADPRAAAHILNNSDNIWHIEHFSQIATVNLLGRGLIAADGASHKRQKKAIAPGFTSVKIREYTSAFYDCAHKIASKWATELESAESTTTDISKWFSAYSLDTVGLGGLGYDMGALDERPSVVAASFEHIANAQPAFIDALGLVLTFIHPIFGSLPTPRNRAINEMSKACTDLSQAIISRARAEEKGERSVMGLLVQAETASSGPAISEEEVTSQVRTLITAGYETTSAALTWIVLELCKDLELQARVRAELLAAFPAEDPTHDELTNDLPLLDAVLHEVFRIYPPLFGARRMAVQDDIVPLLKPITLPNGTVTDHVVMPKGTDVSIQTEVMNCARALWGEDAAVFRPSRWMEPLPEGAQAMAGYRHLATFLDGPKVCLGRAFAVTNIKVLMATLIRRFTFELPGGPEPKIVMKQTLVQRPALEGGDGFAIPVMVRRVVE